MKAAKEKERKKIYTTEKVNTIHDVDWVLHDKVGNRKNNIKKINNRGGPWKNAETVGEYILLTSSQQSSIGVSHLPSNQNQHNFSPPFLDLGHCSFSSTKSREVNRRSPIDILFSINSIWIWFV
jgi:hypothetical protein